MNLLKKWVKPVLLILVFLISLNLVIAAVNCPSYADSQNKFKSIVKIGLNQYSNDDSSLTRAEINDLSEFYNQDWENVDCNSRGTKSNKRINDILEKIMGPVIVTSTSGVEESKPQCIDSDSGKDIYLKGITTLTEEHVDTCWDFNLDEYYCGNLINKKQTFFVSVNNEDKQIFYKSSDNCNNANPKISFSTFDDLQTIEASINENHEVNVQFYDKDFKFKVNCDDNNKLELINEPSILKKRFFCEVWCQDGACVKTECETCGHGIAADCDEEECIKQGNCIFIAKAEGGKCIENCNEFEKLNLEIEQCEEVDIEIEGIIKRIGEDLVIVREKKVISNDLSSITGFASLNNFNNKKIKKENNFVPDVVSSLEMDNYLESKEELLFSAGEEIKEPTIYGYIIELNEEPLVKKEAQLKQLAEANEEKIESMGVLNPLKYGYKAFATQTEDIPKKLKKHNQTIASEHKNLKKDLVEKGMSQITGGAVYSAENGTIILSEYSKVFNGLALNISKEQADELKKSKYVKNVYPNLKVELSLMDSVPLIGADQVWQLDKDGNDCVTSGKECLTGKGTTIAIIDTGIDYTHPDLGGCFGSELIEKGSIVQAPGWPVEIKPTYTVVDNINSDPQKEIITVAWDQEYGTPGKYKLFVYNHDGTLVNGFPKETYLSAKPLISDIYDNGQKEILVTGDKKLHIFKNDGSYKPGFPKTLSTSTFFSTPAVADLTNNGKNEIIVGTGSFSGKTGEEGKIYVFDSNGNILWSKSLGGDYRVDKSSPVVGDINGDGKLEIIHGAIQKFGQGKNSKIYAWNHDGTLVNGFPVELQNNDLNNIDQLSEIILVDSNGDGKKEIFVVSFQNKIYGINGNGNFLPNWPKNFDFELNTNLLFIDIDNDKNKELIFSANKKNKIYAYNLDGSIVNGWPKKIPVDLYTGFVFSFGDVDNDGINEMLVKSDSKEGSNYVHTLYAIDYINNEIVWSKKLKGQTLDSFEPIISDINNDGRNEIIVTDSSGGVI